MFETWIPRPFRRNRGEVRCGDGRRGGPRPEQDVTTHRRAAVDHARDNAAQINPLGLR